MIKEREPVPKVSTIAIDGPAASGKTVVGRTLAKRLSFRFLDTGLMYRAMTLFALTSFVSSIDGPGLTKLAIESLINVTDDPSDIRVFLRNQDVTEQLHTTAVEEAVPRISAIVGVRTALVTQQRDIAAPGSIVMVGRDIGTVVLIDADIKIFLEASAEERAKRRQTDHSKTVARQSIKEVRENLESRDRQDTERTASPLKAADDAHIITTDGLSINQVVEQIINLTIARS